MKELTNQILVTDKVFITPEFKIKKKVYKWHFILSIFLVICLFSYYIYAEYDKVKSEEVSKTLLSKINFDEIQEDEEEQMEFIDTTIRTKDDVIIVILDPTDPIPVEEEVNIDDLQQSEFTPRQTGTSSSKSNSYAKPSVLDTNIYTAKDGTYYRTVAIIDIPSINVHYPVIAPLDEDLQDYTAILKISPCRYYGPEPNEVGNYCIVGHNYRNKKFFSRVPYMELGDTIQLTDSTGRVITYGLYDKYVVDPTDQECTDQRTEGKRVVTLITCTNDSKQRWILKFIEM